MVLVKVNALLHTTRMRISGLWPRRRDGECDRCSQGLGRLDCFGIWSVFGGGVLGCESVGWR